LALARVYRYLYGNHNTGDSQEIQYRTYPALCSSHAAPTRAMPVNLYHLAALFAICRDAAKAHPTSRNCHLEIETPADSLVNCYDTIGNLLSMIGSVDERICRRLASQFSSAIISRQDGKHALRRVIDVTRGA